MTAPLAHRPPTQRERMKAIIGGSAGNLVEWYDWYAYAAFTLYFAPHFFPSDDRTAQLLGAAGIFAVGFLMRPIGAWMMGVYADRHGRKSGLTLSLVAGVLVMAGLIIVTGYTSINAVVKAELFPAHIRALGVALPYALANTLFGGTAEFVALYFKHLGIEHAFYIYVTIMIAISLIMYVRMRDTQKHSRILED